MSEASPPDSEALTATLDRASDRTTRLLFRCADGHSWQLTADTSTAAFILEALA